MKELTMAYTGTLLTVQGLAFVTACNSTPSAKVSKTRLLILLVAKMKLNNGPCISFFLRNRAKKAKSQEAQCYTKWMLSPYSLKQIPCEKMYLHE